MKVLVLGASGMLGHKTLQHLSGHFEAAGTVRGDVSDYARLPALAGMHLLPRVHAEELSTLTRALDDFQPAAVINCIGVIKHVSEAKDPRRSIFLNALLPHELASACVQRGARLVHFSTDCVFSGRDGNYTEDSPSDAEDLYGKTKYLGEAALPGCLTLRTSIVGRELRGKHGLFEWFFSQQGGSVKGFANALYNGLTTNAMARLVQDLLERFPEMYGLWQVSSNEISKYDLLRLVDEVFELKIRIERDESFHCDRRLDNARFRAATGFQPASWREMLEDMKRDPTHYGCAN